MTTVVETSAKSGVPAIGEDANGVFRVLPILSSLSGTASDGAAISSPYEGTVLLAGDGTVVNAGDKTAFDLSGGFAGIGLYLSANYATSQVAHASTAVPVWEVRWRNPGAAADSIVKMDALSGATFVAPSRSVRITATIEGGNAADAQVLFTWRAVPAQGGQRTAPQYTFVFNRQLAASTVDTAFDVPENCRLLVMNVWNPALPDSTVPAGTTFLRWLDQSGTQQTGLNVFSSVNATRFGGSKSVKVSNTNAFAVRYSLIASQMV